MIDSAKLLKATLSLSRLLSKVDFAYLASTMSHHWLPCASSSRPEHVLVKPQSSDVLVHHYPYVLGHRQPHTLGWAANGGVAEDRGNDNPDDREKAEHDETTSRLVVGRVEVGVEDP